MDPLGKGVKGSVFPQSRYEVLGLQVRGPASTGYQVL